MFKNLLKIAFRNIIRHKVFSFINIIGLAIGIAACLLILFWVRDEFSFDRYNKNFESIYRIIHQQKFDEGIIQSSRAPVPLGSALKDNFPEIINYTRFGTFVGEVLIRHDENAFYELGGAYVDPTYFEIFTVKFLRGKKEDIFPDRFSTVITESIAIKYFGDEDPIGKTLILENICELKITAIIADIPRNSHLRFDFAVPFILYEAWGADLTKWDAWPAYTYVQLTKNASVDVVNAEISNYLQTVMADNKDTIFLQPLSKIHLYSNYAYDSPAILGDINNVYIFSIIGLFILIIACINFINLTTAGSMKRAKEIGIRKVVGANKRNLITQFLGETIILAILAFVIALMLLELILPYFNELAGTKISLYIINIRIVFSAIVLLVLTGLISGIYPAFYLSSFKPAKTLKGELKFGSKSAYFRKGLIVFQFFLSVTLIICTLIVFKQMHYIQNKKLGFNKNFIVNIQSRPGMYQDYYIFKEKLSTYPGIINVSATGEDGFPVPLPNNSVSWSGKDPTTKQIFYYSRVDYDYFETFEIDFKSGRSFSREFSSDSLAVVLNESAVRLMDLEHPIGERININNFELTIIGVVKDFHNFSLHAPISPLITAVNPRLPFSLYVRIEPNNIQQNLKIIEEEWYKIIPDFPFVYTFLDDKLGRLYESEQQIGKILTYFAFLAIFISCLGLLGLTMFTVESRMKEIGVRKVFGSTSSRIVFMLSHDFARFVILGNILAWPVAWFIMREWLQSFEYKTKISVWIFLVAGLLTIIISFLTISIRTIKSAHANPVEALKYE